MRTVNAVSSFSLVALIRLAEAEPTFGEKSPYHQLRFRSVLSTPSVYRRFQRADECSGRMVVHSSIIAWIEKLRKNGIRALCEYPTTRELLRKGKRYAVMPSPVLDDNAKGCRCLLETVVPQRAFPN